MFPATTLSRARPAGNTITRMSATPEPSSASTTRPAMDKVSSSGPVAKAWTSPFAALPSFTSTMPCPNCHTYVVFAANGSSQVTSTSLPRTTKSTGPSSGGLTSNSVRHCPALTYSSNTKVMLLVVTFVDPMGGVAISNFGGVSSLAPPEGMPTCAQATRINTATLAIHPM